MGNREISKVLLAIIVILIVVIVGGTIVILNTPIFQSLENISAPIQNKCEYELVSTAVDRQTTKMMKMYSYEITGVIIGLKEYFPVNTIDKLSIRDVAIGWGILTQDNNYEKFKYYTIVNRASTWDMSGDVLTSLGGVDEINKNMSLNHLIYSNQETRDQMSELKIGDYVRIKGYLVNVDFAIEGEWNTSITRDDKGNNSGEIIYVESIKWLKKV